MDRLRTLMATALAALAAAGGAAAHGDPTGHYLETDYLLTSYGSPPATAVELRLRGLLEAVARRGYPIKVSLVASTYDTGGDAGPLASPQVYAEYVSSELASIAPVRAPVLIVTPRKIGVSGNLLRAGRLRPVSRADALELVRGIELPRRADGNALARATMLAVRNMARAAGRPLPQHVPPAEQNLTRIASPSPSASTGGIGAWGIALVVGSALLLGSVIFAVVRRASRRAAAGLPSD